MRLIRVVGGVLMCCLVVCSAAQAAPIASVSVTAFSPNVSGNIGEQVAGVSVSVALMRQGPISYIQVASGSAVTQPGKLVVDFVAGARAAPEWDRSA